MEANNIQALRHSAAHVMAQAVKELFPGVKLGIGPAVEDGFYYDFFIENSFTPGDIDKIEKKMGEIVSRNLPFVKKALPRAEAREFFAGEGEKFKVELIDGIADEEIFVYSNGDFFDLCRGPHVGSTGEIGAFKLLSTSNAYWKGDEKREPLQRIYGTAFYGRDELEDYLRRVEKARANDHRKLGAELELFSIHEDAGAGLIYWHPKGAMLRKTIEDFWKEEHIKRGYDLVYIPHIARGELWKISGHYDYYKENMYFVKDSGDDYVLKPMNCPGHILIYKTKKKSYRELPVKYAELGTVYRQERSGVLHGMFRVRGFTQDDAHIFCTREQVPGELVKVLELVKFMLESFGFTDYEIDLSVRGKDKKKYAGSDSDWEMAESGLMDALEKSGLSCRRVEGEAVFYGPKIDFKLKGVIGSWQGPTVQFDFNLPERFRVQYVGSDGGLHNVVMIHRTVLGSMERFIGILIETCGGRFPLWLAPVQVKILTVARDSVKYGEDVYLQLKNQGIRVELDSRDEKIGLKIRESEMEKVPYLAILGNREAGEGTVSLRNTLTNEKSVLQTDSFMSMLKNEIQLRGA